MYGKVGIPVSCENVVTVSASHFLHDLKTCVYWKPGKLSNEIRII